MLVSKSANTHQCYCAIVENGTCCICAQHTKMHCNVLQHKLITLHNSTFKIEMHAKTSLQCNLKHSTAPTPYVHSDVHSMV